MRESIDRERRQILALGAAVSGGFAMEFGQARAAVGPERRPDAARAATPIIAGEDCALDAERIDQRNQIGANRRLLTRARCNGIEKTGRAIAAQIRNDGAATFGGESRRDVHIGMNVVGKAVQKHDGRTVRRTLLVIGNIKDAGIDRTNRLQAAQRGRTRRTRDLADATIGSARLTELHGETS